jgi:hypothetical protein
VAATSESEESSNASSTSTLGVDPRTPLAQTPTPHGHDDDANDAEEDEGAALDDGSSSSSSSSSKTDDDAEEEEDEEEDDAASDEEEDGGMDRVDTAEDMDALTELQARVWFAGSPAAPTPAPPPRAPLAPAAPKAAAAPAAVSAAVSVTQAVRTMVRPPPRYLYLQMEYCENETLRDVIDGRTPLPRDDVARWLRQLVSGLHYIHAQGVTHRDLKPSNVFLDAHRNVKIGDFGLALDSAGAAAAGAGAAMSGTVGGGSSGSGGGAGLAGGSSGGSLSSDVGTAAYIAPEMRSSLSDVGGASATTTTTANNNNHSTTTTSASAIASAVTHTATGVGAAGGGAGARYGPKVDIYSLGIIYFEMLYRFATGMERTVVLARTWSAGARGRHAPD